MLKPKSIGFLTGEMQINFAKQFFAKRFELFEKHSHILCMSHVK